ncbi:MAG: DUF1223 domain-containing protein, partial [Bacteroidota bacterium]
SCPPADRVLQDLVADADEEGLPVIGLSFHVDYWNYLGWADPFSDAAYSSRQRNYNRSLKDGVYTPQMVVNGTRSFVGSRRGEALLAVKDALSKVPKTPISLDTKGLLGKKQTFTYSVTDLQPGQRVMVALVERNLSRDVSRGENRGRTLHHTQVVRHFAPLEAPVDGKGRFSLDLPEDANPEETFVVCFVQGAGLGPITGGVQLPWNTETAN